MLSLGQIGCGLQENLISIHDHDHQHQHPTMTKTTIMIKCRTLERAVVSCKTLWSPGLKQTRVDAVDRWSLRGYSWSLVDWWIGASWWMLLKNKMMKIIHLPCPSSHRTAHLGPLDARIQLTGRRRSSASKMRNLKEDREIGGAGKLNRGRAPNIGN